MKETDVLLIGGYPPPIGGVTIHIKRLAETSFRNGIETRILNHLPSGDNVHPPYVVSLKGSKTTVLRSLLGKIKNSDAKIIHLHVSKMGNLMITLPLLLYAARGKQRILTCHSGDFVNSIQQPPLKKRVLQQLLRHFTKLIPVNDQQKEFYRNEMDLNERVTEVIPSFIQPEQKLVKTDDPNLKQLKAIKSKFRHVILTSGMYFPYYNFEKVIRCVKKINADADVALVCCFYGTADEAYKPKVLEQVKAEELVFDFHQLPEEIFLKFLKEASLYVRATDIDSVGMVVFEALGLQTPVIASDVCKRPSGTRVVDITDEAALCKEIESVLAAASSTKQRQFSVQDHGASVVQLYRTLLQQ